MEEKKESYYLSLIKNLLREKESETLEFKLDNEDPELIGEYLSSLSNSATLSHRNYAYLVYGIKDDNQQVVGTKFDPANKKIGNEELVSWLSRLLTPKIDFRFIDLTIEDKRVVLVEVPSSKTQPVSFKGVEYIRIGSYNKKLRDFPEKERALWQEYNFTPIEERAAIEDISLQDIASYIQIGSFYDLLELPYPSSIEKIAKDLIEYGLIAEKDNGNFDIRNFGALLFAKDLGDYRQLANKAVRVIKYNSSNRVNANGEREFRGGYAAIFKELMGYIMALVPSQEKIDGVYREERSMFPEKAIREAVANMMAHQDLSIKGSYNLIEIFPNRIEVTSPGNLLVDKDHILDSAPRTRNEKLANFLRLVRIIESRGSGFDRMEESLSLMHLPSPKVESYEDFTKISLVYHDYLKEWSEEEKMTTIYLHTVFCYLAGESSNNASIRERLGISESNKAIASRLISLAIGKGKIKILDSSSGVKNRRYIPYWA